jgi:hypothetical protein
MIRCAEVVGVTLTPEVRVSPAESLRFDAVGQSLLPNQSSNVLIECSIVNPLKSDYVHAVFKNPSMLVRKSARLNKLNISILSTTVTYFSLLPSKLLVPLFLMVCLLCLILFSLVEDIVHLMRLGMRLLLNLGPINKSHLPCGYQILVIV